jgi:hypothetical protein
MHAKSHEQVMNPASWPPGEAINTSPGRWGYRANFAGNWAMIPSLSMSAMPRI